MKRKKQNTSQSIELFASLFNPTIEMAAELMGVSSSVVEEWLAQEHLSLVWENKLSDKALDFLAQKYVSRLHRYFINCKKSWAEMDAEDRALFREFTSKYGRFIFFWAKEWKDINTKRIERDFKKELRDKAVETYFHDITPYTFSPIEIEELSRSQDSSLYEHLCSPVYIERPSLLTVISHNLYFRARIKTHIPSPPELRHIFLEILQENRFHIFTGESEDNVIIDANSSSKNVNQPQLAIVPVFGYYRHKNNVLYEKNKVDLCCPA